MATTARKPRRSTPKGDAAGRKLIYTFREGNATMRQLLGGKGAGLAEMTNAGLPVPAGLHDHDRGVQRLLRVPASSCPTGCGTTSWPT